MSLVLEKLKLSNPSVKTSFSLQVFSPITLYMGKKESKYVIYHILAWNRNSNHYHYVPHEKNKKIS